MDRGHAGSVSSVATLGSSACKQTYWALDEGHRDQLIKQHGKANSKPSITRFKRRQGSRRQGSGETNTTTCG